MRNYFLILLLLFSFALNAQQIKWTQAAPGVWKGIAGTPESYDLLKAAGSVPNREALEKMPAANFPFVENEIVLKLLDGKTSLRFPLDQDEQLYGFGLNFQTVHQRGKILQLHVDHYGGKDNGRTHAPVPFYVSSKGYGVFINVARYITVYAGSGVRKDAAHPPVEKDRNTDKTWSSRPYSDAVEIMVPAAGTEIYVFAGPATLDAVRRFNLFNGGGVLPPRWGLGFTQRVRSLFSADEVKKEANDFLEKGYPLDFIGLEPGWQSRAYPGSFEWDKTRFPEPKKFVQEMLEKNIRLNLWINPYVSKQASIYKSIAPYTGSHTVWVGEVPDFTIPAARKIFFDQLQKDQVDIGISGYKIDEVDGYDHYLWPDVASFPSGLSAEQMRQTYGVLTMRYSAEMFRAKNQRTYGLVRASNAGAVSFPYVIYNDYYNHEDFITALINSGYAGVLWTPEARASKSAEEWLRRFQTVIFSPMAMINAWASGTKPWSYPEVAEEIKKLALLRMQMMPYWYSEFAKYHFEGTPVFRGMSLEEGFRQEVKKETGSSSLEENPYAEATSKEIKDQYMAGEYLLVAPMFSGQTTRKVVLPRGNWYDFYTGRYVGNGEVLTITPGLNKIPVYAKEGAIIPMMQPRLHAPKAGEKVDLEIRHYGQRISNYLLYDDDGETFDYEKGAYSWRLIEVGYDKNNQLTGSISPPAPGKPNTIGKLTFRFMSAPDHAVRDEAEKLLKPQVLKEAAWALQQKPETVTAKPSPRSAGGKHDFYSEGDYWWPNPASADSPYIQRDGMTNPDNFVAHRHAMIRLSRIVGALGSAYTITKDEKYVRQALTHCRAWFIDTTTLMNPHLLYAQAIKGRATGRGIGIIDAIQLMEVVQGLQAMENAKSMDKQVLAGIKKWFAGFNQWLTTHQYGKDEMNAANNHGTCWVMQVAVFAKFTGNTQLMRFCSDRYKQVLLPNQMATDGSFPLELRRTKPYGYSIFNLDAMATICQVLSSGADNLWEYHTPDGKTIRLGIGYLYQHIADKTKWPHKQDVMYWENWPVAQPFLIFGANAFQNKAWFQTWKKLDHAPEVDEVIRNLPVRNPLIWFR
jgi:alpha-glucosidase (family GH31 glycosyl hydrolase)